MALKDWKEIRKNVWYNMKYNMIIKYWSDFESGGYDVYKGKRKLNKIWLSSYPKALKSAKAYMRKH